MRLLLLIIGFVFGSYLIFIALAKSKLRKYARFHQEFDQTWLKNSHTMLKTQGNLQDADPLLEIAYDEILAAQGAKVQPLIGEKTSSDHKHHHSDGYATADGSAPQYAWEAALNEEDIKETEKERGQAVFSVDEIISDEAACSDYQQLAWEAGQLPAEKPVVYQDFIALTILPKNRLGFTGHALLAALKVNYFYYGKQKVFNRHIGDDPRQSILFSVASLTEPGIFEQKQMSKDIFPGVIIFMLLPASTNALTTFEKMFATARQLADSLNADLGDMKRNPLSIRTLSQYRDRIRSSQYARFSQGG